MSTDAREPAPVARLTVLADNHVAVPGLEPVAGLAVMVEAGGRRVLFDTGVDAQTVANADGLRVPLTGLNAVVLSHGHDDHVGGLAAVLARSGPVPVIAHPDLFRKACARGEDGGLADIGPPLSREQYAALGAGFCARGDVVTLGETMTTTGDVRRSGVTVPPRPPFLRETAEGIVPDEFGEETSLVIASGTGALVLTGCAHQGPVQIIRHLRNTRAGSGPVTLMGGFHLGDHGEEEVRQIASALHALGVVRLLPCHCTTTRASLVLADAFPGPVDLIGAGSEVDLGEDGSVTVRHPWEPA